MGTANRHEGKPNPNRRSTPISLIRRSHRTCYALCDPLTISRSIVRLGQPLSAYTCAHLRFESLSVFIRGVPFVSIRAPIRGLNLNGSGPKNGTVPDSDFDGRVTRLAVYPVKGLGGQLLEKAEVQERGFAWDRRWMLVGEDHRFLSQRQLPKMVTIKAGVNVEELVLSHGTSQITVPVKPPETASKIQATIWNDRVEAVFLPDPGQWLSEILHHRCDLVFMPDTTRRAVNPAFAQAGDIVGFADAYPILLIGEASMADLNARLADPVPIDRFRPNIVVSSQEPFVEDQWGELAVGSALLRGTKVCARCSVPTIDQLTGENTGPEPIRTLSSYRRFGTGIYLGQNLTVRRTGSISLGDAVSVWNRIGAVYS
jgi:uncharacterized protein YcbX